MKLVSSASDFFSEISAEIAAAHPDVRILHYNDGASSDKNDILCSDSFEPIQIVNAIVASGSRHFIQKNKNYFQEDVKLAADIVADPKIYFQRKTESILGLKKKYIEIPFSRSEDKESVKEKIANFIEDIKNNALEESLNAVFEELFMNAIIDAPREYLRIGKNKHLYDEGQTAKLHLQTSDNRLVIACEDPFGALVLGKLLARMHEVYQKGAGEAINLHQPGGAGLGCVMMFENSISLYVGVQSGVSTLVSCVLPIGMSYRQKAAIKKSLHLIEI